MEEPNDERLEVILRLHQVLEDFQAVSSELRDVLAIMTSWHESGLIAASPLGWPHEESLKRDIRKWLEDTVGPEGEDHPEQSRAFITRGEAVRVSAWHVLDDFWQVSTRGAAPGQGGADGVGEGELTAVAFLRVSPGAEAPPNGRPGPGRRCRRPAERPKGGLAPLLGGTRRIRGGARRRNAARGARHRGSGGTGRGHRGHAENRRLLLERGAPPAAGDWLYGWAGVELDPDGWLWVSYRPG